MKRNLIIAGILIAILNCEKDITIETQKKNAENCLNEAMVAAKSWLETLDEMGYQVLADYTYPPPFDKIVGEDLNREKLQKGIHRMEQEFGKVKERKFFGVHVLLEGKLLTYVPEKMKSFKQMNPRRLGIKNIKDLYKDKIEGTYAFLIYDLLPTKKTKAEELIAMWRDKNNK